MVPPSSAALPTGVLFATLGSLLGPVAILAVVATIVALVVVVAGVLTEHRDAAAFQRRRHSLSRPGPRDPASLTGRRASAAPVAQRSGPGGAP